MEQMPLGLFSTYAQGENRVTASVLAVLGSSTLDRMQRLVRALIGEQSLGLVIMRNQIAVGAGSSVPDAEIGANFRILIETKTVRNGVSVKQLDRHLALLSDRTGFQRLLVLTPDEEMPETCRAVAARDERLVWTSFASLNQAVDDLVGDPDEVISEREAFLLRELQYFLDAEGLLSSPEDVLVVPARWAWPLYQAFGVYLCQPERSFRTARYLGFYADQAIQPVVPQIEQRFSNVSFEVILSDAEADPWLKQTCQTLVEQSYFKLTSLNTMFRLTSPNDSRTLRLLQPIVNDWTDKRGRKVAFTMGQRYVRSTALRSARTTTDLIDQASASEI